MPIISVIVPVYKAEKYINACVSSILAQSFRDFELILVDDGSPDRSGAICDDYAKKDSRIRVIHKENGGAASARNAGLDAANGDHIAFVDGDDLIHPQYLDFLLRLLLDQDADIAMCHYDFFEDEKTVFSGNPQGDVTILRGPELLDSFHEHSRKVSLVSLCMKLFKRSIFDGFRIPEGFTEEDSMSLPHILERSGIIVRSEAKLYHWRITPGSVTRVGLNEKYFATVEVAHYQAEFFLRRNHAQADYFMREYLCRALNYYYQVRDKGDPALMRAFKPWLRQYKRLFPRYIRAKGMARREKLAYWLFLISPKQAEKHYLCVYRGVKK